MLLYLGKLAFKGTTLTHTLCSNVAAAHAVSHGRGPGASTVPPPAVATGQGGAASAILGSSSFLFITWRGCGAPRAAGATAPPSAGAASPRKPGQKAATWVSWGHSDLVERASPKDRYEPPQALGFLGPGGRQSVSYGRWIAVQLQKQGSTA